MRDGNWYLVEALAGMRADEMRRDAERARFMKEHAMDLRSLLRAALASRRARRGAAGRDGAAVRRDERLRTRLAL